MKNKIVLAGIALTVVTGGAWGWFVAWPTHSIEKIVRNGLKDPDSAKFANVKYFRETKSGCGSVNSKNSMGGYVGNVLFVADLDDGSVEFSSPGNSSGDYVALANDLKFMELRIKNCPAK